MFSFFDGSKLPAEVSIFFIAPIAWDQNGPNPKNPRKLKKVAESLLTVSATPVIVLSFGPPFSQRATSISKNICTYCKKKKKTVHCSPDSLNLLQQGRGKFNRNL